MKAGKEEFSVITQSKWQKAILFSKIFPSWVKSKIYKLTDKLVKLKLRSLLFLP